LLVNVWVVQMDPTVWENPTLLLPNHFIGSGLEPRLWAHQKEMPLGFEHYGAGRISSMASIGNLCLGQKLIYPLIS
ncbi:hypothetical protein SELMODRAFT_109058, partial [Selaginella moellendorffii]